MEMKTQLSLNGNDFGLCQINDNIIEAITHSPKTNGGTYYSKPMIADNWYTAKNNDVTFDETSIPNKTTMDPTNGSFAYLSSFSGTGSVTVHYYHPQKGWVHQGIASHTYPNLSGFNIEMVNELMVIVSAFNSTTNKRSTLVYVLIEKAISLQENQNQRFTYKDIGVDINQRCQMSYDVVNGLLYVGVINSEVFNLVSIAVSNNLASISDTYTPVIQNLYGFAKAQAISTTGVVEYVTLDNFENKLKLIKISNNTVTAESTYPYKLLNISAEDLAIADTLMYSSRSNRCFTICLSRKPTRSIFVVFYYDLALQDYVVSEYDVNSFVEHMFIDNNCGFSVFGLNTHSGYHGIARAEYNNVTKQIEFYSIEDAAKATYFELDMADVSARKVVAFNRDNNSFTFIESRLNYRLTNYLLIDREVSVIDTRHSVDFEIDYRDIDGIPLSSVAAIDSMVLHSHEHSNHNVLNKLNRGTKDQLIYDSKLIKLTKLSSTW